MTREEVKAQLAKCPLEWEDGEARLANLTQCLEVKYSITWGELAVDMCSPEDCLREYIASGFCGVQLKAKAETHRLDLICRLLGIND